MSSDASIPTFHPLPGFTDHTGFQLRMRAGVKEFPHLARPVSDFLWGERIGNWGDTRNPPGVVLAGESIGASVPVLGKGPRQGHTSDTLTGEGPERLWVCPNPQPSRLTAASVMISLFFNWCVYVRRVHTYTLWEVYAE